MEGAVATSEELKNLNPNIKTLFVGGHISALPKETLENEKSELEIILMNSADDFEKFNEASLRMGEVMTSISEKTSRWMELVDYV